MFRGWNEVIQTEKEFVASLSRLARKLDHSALKQAFDDVNNFSSAKAVSQKEQKGTSSRRIREILNELCNRRLRDTMQTLRNTSLTKGRAFEAKKLAVVHAMMGKMRSYWQHWKQKTEQRAVMEEIHDEGPRRLEYLKDR